MKLRLPLLLYIFLLCILATLSCEKDNDVLYQSTNKPPLANAGPDQTLILPKDSTVLDGSGSYDPDGTIAQYRWAKITGPASCNIVDGASISTKVNSLVQGVYLFELLVTDNREGTARDTVRVSVQEGNGENYAPVAQAGQDQILILPANFCTLNGTASYDQDGSITAYQWSKVAGPASLSFENAASAQTRVSSLVEGVYQFELKVTDDKGTSAKDTVRITVNPGTATNQLPVAQAGPDLNIMLPVNYCTLNGSESYDPDGNIIAYQWTKIAGSSSCKIESPIDRRTRITGLSIGIYQFELQVTDNGGLAAKDTVKITVNPEGSSGCDVSGRPQINATQTVIGTLSQARMPAVAAAGSKIVFAGGVFYTGNYYNISSNVDIYDVNTHTWTQAQLSRPREGIAAVSCGSKIFFAGGGFFYISFDVVDIYDVNTNKWTTARLSEPRAYMTAAAVGDKVLFAGGLKDGSWQASNTVDIYDLSTNTWSTATLSEPKGELGAVTVGNKVYFAGGSNGIGPSGRIDIYDNSKTTNQWSTASLQELKGDVSGVVVGENIYWAGVAHPLNTGKVEIFNTNDHTSKTIGCLSYPRRFPVAVAKNSEIAFFPNGVWNNDDFTPLKNQFDIYNLATGKWSIGLLNERIEAAGIIKVNNTIYMGGGRIKTLECTNNVYALSW